MGKWERIQAMTVKDWEKKRVGGTEDDHRSGVRKESVIKCPDCCNNTSFASYRKPETPKMHQLHPPRNGSQRLVPPLSPHSVSYHRSIIHIRYNQKFARPAINKLNGTNAASVPY